MENNWQLGLGGNLEPDRGLPSKDGRVWALEECNRHIYKGEVKLHF